MTRTDELRGGSRERLAHAPNGARELLAASIGGEDPYARLYRLDELGQQKAEAEAVWYRLDKERKALIARLATEYASTHAKENLSEAKLDRLARADQRYQKHIEGLAVALENKERLNAEYWGLKAGLEWDARAVAHYNAMSRLGEPT